MIYLRSYYFEVNIFFNGFRTGVSWSDERIGGGGGGGGGGGAERARETERQRDREGERESDKMIGC